MSGRVTRKEVKKRCWQNKRKDKNEKIKNKIKIS